MDKVVSADRILRYAQSDDTYRTIMWHGVQILLRKFISFRECVDCVESILQASDNGYRAEMVDFALRANVLMSYSNIELPDDIESQYKMLYGSDIYHFILTNINEEQVNSIRYAVELRIKS